MAGSISVSATGQDLSLSVVTLLGVGLLLSSVRNNRNAAFLLRLGCISMSMVRLS